MLRKGESHTCKSNISHGRVSKGKNRIVQKYRKKIYIYENGNDNNDRKRNGSYIRSCALDVLNSDKKKKRIRFDASENKKMTSKIRDKNDVYMMYIYIYRNREKRKIAWSSLFFGTR